MQGKRTNGKDRGFRQKPQQVGASTPNNGYYAAIDLGTNSCRLVIAEPTPSSFHVVETFSRITRLGEDIIHGNMLTKPAIRRTISALKVCSAIVEEYCPIVRMRFVATAACRRALNCADFEKAVEFLGKSHFQKRISRIIYEDYPVRTINDIHRVFETDLKNPFKTVFKL